MPPAAELEPSVSDLDGGNYDVAVIGAGPAGAMAALAAARAGRRRVLLIDKAKFPRAKPCGCCISGAARAALEAAGLHDVLDAARPLHRFALTAAGRTATLSLHGSCVLSRSALDAALVERACDAGATFVDGFTASHAGTDDTDQRLRLHSGGRAPAGEASVTARAIVVADGVGGRFLHDDARFTPRVARRARVGLAATIDSDICEPDCIRMACGSAGYAGFVQLEDARANIAAAIDPAAFRAGPAHAVQRIVDEAGLALDRDALGLARWRGTGPLTRRRNAVAATNIFVVGDAAGYVEPFTGEGIAWALATGTAAGCLAARTPLEPRRAAAHWQRQWADLVRGPQRRCRLIAAMLRRPAVVAAGVAVLHHAPGLAAFVTRRLATPLEGATA